VTETCFIGTTTLAPPLHVQGALLLQVPKAQLAACIPAITNHSACRSGWAQNQPASWMARLTLMRVLMTKQIQGSARLHGARAARTQVPVLAVASVSFANTSSTLLLLLFLDSIKWRSFAASCVVANGHLIGNRSAVSAASRICRRDITLEVSALALRTQRA
jgi:predicted amidohydrolase